MGLIRRGYRDTFIFKFGIRLIKCSFKFWGRVVGSGVWGMGEVFWLEVGFG